ncbi:MAG TPA: hypothetical protein VEV83_14430 [Parafilimonas sp.]|nr:hypothetical protein [Parafilimonas sp.]
MKMKGTPIVILFLFITCTKEKNLNKQTSSALTYAVALDTAMIPLNDLGTGTFMGYTGGLYPGGANNASGQYASDLLAFSNSIVPIDKSGTPSSTGKVVFISLGASIGGRNMVALKAKTTNNPATNPNLLLLNCNQGSGFASLNDIMNPKSVYWLHVDGIVKQQSSYRQVQVIYLETDDSARVRFPGKPLIVKDHIDSCLRVIKQKFRNAKVVYVEARTRTFAGFQNWNKEPGPYYFGWACKWAVEDQINGVPGTQYKGPKPVAPMITWGFYEWADSLPRTTDSFYWRSYMTRDGLHATTEYQDTLALRFQKFLLTDPYASIWYAKH